MDLTRPAFAFALCLFLLPGLAAAESALSVKEIEARSYESLENMYAIRSRPVNLSETFGREGALILDIRAVFAVDWSDDVQRISAGSRDISVVLETGFEVGVVGGFEFAGMPMLAVQSFSQSRPRNWPDEDADLHWRGLFMVPEGSGTVTLQIGGDHPVTAEVAVPAPGVMESATEAADFALVGLDRFRSLRHDQGRDDSLLRVRHEAPEGMVFLDVGLRVSALAANTTSGDDFFSWWSSSLRLVDPAGETLWSVGQRTRGEINDRRFNGVPVGSEETVRMIWMVPEDLAAATVWFAGEPLLELAIDGSIRDEG